LTPPNAASSASRRSGRGHGVGLPSFIVKTLLVTLLLVVPLVEAGSWFITRVQLDSDATSAGIEAAYAVENLPVTTRSAQKAYDTAVEALASEGGDGIDPKQFRLLADGSVEFVAYRAAPSVVLAHLDLTRHLMTVQTRVTATPSA
jgi:hypothetical protein